MANFPGAPRLTLLPGHPPSTFAATDLTNSEPLGERIHYISSFDSQHPIDNVTGILARFKDAGFALIAAVAQLPS